MNSICLWKDKVQDERQAILIAKTTQACIPVLIDKVTSMHSYECPCILSLPLSDGNRRFLDWIDDATEPAPPAS
jgi:periplasmic divalent cation tolerance protein